MAKINWGRTRKFRDYEEKYEPGTQLPNGRIVVARRPDSLAARAAEAEKQWIEGKAQKAKKQRQRRRNARRKPTKAQLQRIKQIRVQLGYSED
jgi:hypothetical protein